MGSKAVELIAEGIHPVVEAVEVIGQFPGGIELVLVDLYTPDTPPSFSSGGRRVTVARAVRDTSASPTLDTPAPPTPNTHPPCVCGGRGYS